MSAVEAISVFDIFKIGVGPSSSHTMGPWRAAQRFVATLRNRGRFDRTGRIRAVLYGSLAKTGKGHGTDVAVLLGLEGEDPVDCEVEGLVERAGEIGRVRPLRLGGSRSIPFDPSTDLEFRRRDSLPFHPNALALIATFDDGTTLEERYYSVGGGFVVQEGEEPSGSRAVRLPCPIDTSADLEAHCAGDGRTIPEVVLGNERTWRGDAQIRAELLTIWEAMQACVWRGCHTDGTLPGGLGVKRRAHDIHDRLLGSAEDLPLGAWLATVRGRKADFQTVLRWVSAFALAVNEENAAFGRVVTAPTNGAAGVIPATLMYYWCFCEDSFRRGDDGVIDFLLTAGEIGSLFKKGATISAAMGGCQAEIGVSAAMAAAGLAQALGGSVGQSLMAAEIAMEHHLGLTCDPIGGLVQIPCIERNIMGAIKAITSAHVALESDPARARVSLDDVIGTMWRTATDMSTKYKETAEGGLALTVDLSEC
ncbi:MAG: L-serine ammonia-lyase [Gemmatimonadales bacterium]